MENLYFILLAIVVLITTHFMCVFMLNKIDKIIFNYCRKKVNKMNIKIEKNG